MLTMKKEITITREQFFEFIKKKGDTANLVANSTMHYLAYFDKYMATGKKAGWNWAALFAGWFFYRRMYLYGVLFPVILYGAILITGGAILVILCLTTMFLSSLSLIVANGMSYETIMVCCSVFLAVVFIFAPLFYVRYGDYAYLRYVQRKFAAGIFHKGVNISAYILIRLWRFLVLSLIISIVESVKQ